MPFLFLAHPHASHAPLSKQPRARTGSGKTLAYLLPALHRILLASAHTSTSSGAPVAAAASTGGSFQALILVPTRELCEQVRSRFSGASSTATCVYNGACNLFSCGM
jgi:superfamily II DNA/RNA helicase